MAEINDYARTYFLIKANGQLSLPKSYRRKDEIFEIILEFYNAYLGEFEVQNLLDCKFLSELIFQEMLDNGVISKIEVDFSGEYYKFVAENYPSFSNQVLSQDPLYQLSKEIGQRFFPELFAAYRSIPDSETKAELIGLGIPASDRVVSLTHNQVSELELATTEIIEAVEDQNKIGDSKGVRELVLGQLKAGRELVRAGCVRAYLVHITLIETLSFLAKRYEKETIGALATALIDALLKYFGNEL